MLSKEMKLRLNELFAALWSDRTGVVGSWMGSSYRYHPTYIRRGPLLLAGETTCKDVYVLDPPTAAVTPTEKNPAASFNPFPKIHGGEAIEISWNEPGPWWDLLAQEIPKMEAELQQSARVRAEKAEEEARQRELKRASLLSRAAAACCAEDDTNV